MPEWNPLLNAEKGVGAVGDTYVDAAIDVDPVAVGIDLETSRRFRRHSWFFRQIE